MDAEIQQRLAVLEKKIDDVYISAEKTRKYFLWTAIGTLVVFLLPLVGLVFAIPQFISLYSNIGSIGGI